MKDFLHNYSYSAIKMFVNQFAISIFGAMLSMATTAAKNDTLAIILSVISILFYLFLLYTCAWEIGAKDRISVDIGKKKYRPHTGLLVSLLANVSNFIIALVFAIFKPLAQSEWAANVCAIASLAATLLEGMYLGVITTVSIGGVPLNAIAITFFVITIPAMITSWIAYFLGFKNKKFTTLFNYQSPDKAKRK
ncbi:MAG: hypothetical protein E7641_00050 [Ruminococcaceae bacterium]|nr:hypothetical protein [Oscillospiraceae bacterium]